MIQIESLLAKIGNLELAREIGARIEDYEKRLASAQRRHEQELEKIRVLTTVSTAMDWLQRKLDVMHEMDPSNPVVDIMCGDHLIATLVFNESSLLTAIEDAMRAEKERTLTEEEYKEFCSLLFKWSGRFPRRSL